MLSITRKLRDKFMFWCLGTIPPRPGIFRLRSGNVRYVAASYGARPVTRSECDEYGINSVWTTVDDYDQYGRCLRGWDKPQLRSRDLIELLKAV